MYFSLFRVLKYSDDWRSVRRAEERGRRLITFVASQHICGAEEEKGFGSLSEKP